jgi:histidine triad (HIT) family protein
MYNHAPPGYVCPFCLLAQGVFEAPVISTLDDLVVQTDSVTALVSSHQWPQNPGNVIILPNRHFENIYDLPVEYALPLHAVAKGIALAMKTGLGCDGVSMRQHNEPAGNQDVWHYHLHITPRYPGDAFYGTARALMPAEERARLARTLRAALGSL